MNERIVELAKQCASQDHLMIYGGNYAKFAELIVRECADLFEVEYGKYAVSGNTVADVLKRHFGVEE